MRVAIVGGGMAGLAAAWDLSLAGAEVVVYESRSVAGGRLRSDVLDGCVLDPAVQLLSSTFTSLHDLLGQAGVAGRLVRAPGRDALWRGGRAHTLTYGSVASLAASGALPVTLKLQMAALYLPFLQRHGRNLDANDPSSGGGPALDGESLASWGKRRLGEDFVELMGYPLLAAYYGGAPEETSAALYHALARVGLEVSVNAAQGGMGGLALALAEGLRARGVEFRMGSAVDAVIEVGGRVQVYSAEGSASYDGAVMATPAPVTAGLLEASPELGGWLAGIRMRPAVTLGLVVEGRIDVPWFGLSFPRTRAPGDRLVALCAQTSKLDSLAPADRDALVAFPAPCKARLLIDAPAEKAVDMLLPAIEAVLPGITERVIRAKVYRFQDGYTLVPPGGLRHMAAYRPEWAGTRLALAGDYLVAPSVEGAVRSGRAAAHRILASVR
jgi:protoporphyrinogen/coproporphyrinogen III oxidase